MRKISELLTDARAIIEDKSHWTQEAHARRANGDAVFADDPGAVCFCADGAMRRAAGTTTNAKTGKLIHDDADSQYMSARNYMHVAALRVSGRAAYMGINDGDFDVPGMDPHTAILAVFSAAIDRAKSAEEIGFNGPGSA
ncbi:hypothetical protein [Bradyrhizobium sp. SZCCHNS3053]|uniref:DUF6197 family protein n=1 Tax=Bradyrhizobium sp. SZCCHNS3053 TaxID=3057322 RepID=UPI002916E37D|nr:hypothetical protein [Bradyrhizobium sp. SZCCHNS3053]